MKFSLFVHMERINPQQSHKELYHEMVDLCEMADNGGFHAIWTGEHHGMDFTIAPNPLINIADLARRTKNVRLGTGTVVAPFWNPIRLAGEAAMTDIISRWPARPRHRARRLQLRIPAHGQGPDAHVGGRADARDGAGTAEAVGRRLRA